MLSARMPSRAIAAACAFWMIASSSANGQSFNCRNARLPDEILICQDSDLSHLDEPMASTYFEVRNQLDGLDRPKFERSQVTWLKERQVCGRDRDCLERIYLARIAQLLRGLNKPTQNEADSANQDRGAAATADRAEREKQEVAAAQAEREKQEQEQKQQQAAVAKKAKEQLRAQAITERQDNLAKKLKDRGFTMEKPIDFELDWRDLAAKSQRVALQGRYVEKSDVEGLIVDDPDLPLIRLYTEGASRDARKMLLTCRVSATASCSVIVGARVATCVTNKGELNEKEVPCLKVEDAFPDPTTEE